MKKVADMPDTNDDGQGFLQRWSQRKLRNRERDDQVDCAPDATTATDTSLSHSVYGEQGEVCAINNATHDASEKNETAGAAVQQAGDLQQEMPDIDSLTAESDLTSFFSEKVSDELRKKALRKIFSFGKYNFCDGLDDYAEDYTKFEPLGNVLTADLKLKIERDRLKKLAELDNSNIQAGNADEGEYVDDPGVEHPDEQTNDDKDYSHSATLQNEDQSQSSENDNDTIAVTLPDGSSSSESENQQSAQKIKRSKET